MNTRHSLVRLLVAAGASAVVCALAFAPSSAFAQAKKKKNPTSKIYCADVEGQAQIDTGDKIEDLSKKSVHSAEGTVIETKPAGTDAMVYSNGTGLFLDEETRLEIKKFVQEPFTPNRTDMDTEPSISQTQTFLSRGAVGLCTSKLVAGSSMNYQTPHGSIAVRGRKVVIASNEKQTVISSLEGEMTVRGGSLDSGGQILKSGEQAIITPGAPGQPNTVKIQPIPNDQAAALDDKVSMACMAKKTVYFEVREKKDDSGEHAVTAFDGDPSKPTTTPKPGGGDDVEIVPVEVVPTKLPVEVAISASRIG